MNVILPPEISTLSLLIVSSPVSDASNSKLILLFSLELLAFFYWFRDENNYWRAGHSWMKGTFFDSFALCEFSIQDFLLNLTKLYF